MRVFIAGIKSFLNAVGMLVYFSCLFSVPYHYFFYFCLFVGLFVSKYSSEIQSNFNGLNTFRTMKISSRQGEFEPIRIDYSVMSRDIIRISFIFYNMRVCCVFSLESPQ